MALPELYKEQEFQRQTFDRNSEFMKHNPNLTARGTRKFNRYWNSDQRLEDEKAFNAAQDAAEVAHIEAEAKKRADSWDARIAALREQNAARGEAALKNINASLAAKPAITTPKPAPVPVVKTLIPRSEADWNRIAKENGFADMGEVLAWQEANGLEADGKFGNASSAFFKANGLGKYQKTPDGYVELSRPDGTTFLQRTGTFSTRNSTPATPTLTTSSEPPKKKNSWFANATMAAAMADAPAVMTASGWRQNEAGDYVQDKEDDPGVERLRNNLAILGGTATGITTSGLMTAGAAGTAAIAAPESTPLLTGPTAKHFLYDAAGKLLMAYKQGGTMNRINYFQQGGAAPQQDIKAQITALVQAAMQGDQKATQQVNQIMEAAKAGDQQAIQIAQIMEQVVKEMQGQARAAKYGAKLNYLQSLKCGGKSMKKKEQGGKVCAECEKQAKPTNKTLITKHQQGKTLDYNKATRFYSKWSEADIRKLKIGLAGYAGYEGDVNSGKIDKEMIDAVARLQGEKKVTSDGMWGHNSNTQIRLVDASTADKGSYKKSWGTEQGSLRTYDVAGQKMKDQDYYKAINDLKEQFYANPEAFWNAGGNTAKWREHLYTTPEGTAIMEEFYSATPDDVRKKLGSRVTNRKMQQDQMDSGIREATGKAADIAVKKVLPAMAGIAAAPAVVMNPLAGLAGVGGAYVGGAAGRQVGENLSAGDTSTWTSVDGMGTVASVATPTSEIVVPIAEAAGGAAGAALGAWGSQYVGTPSTQGLASFRRTNNSAPQFTGRSQNRSGRFKTGGYSLGQEPVQITKGRLGSYTTLGKQPRWANGPFGGQFAKKNSKGMSEDFIRYMEGAKGNPSYSVEFLGM